MNRYDSRFGLNFLALSALLVDIVVLHDVLCVVFTLSDHKLSTDERSVRAAYRASVHIPIWEYHVFLR